jgi:hypothetical protein
MLYRPDEPEYRLHGKFPVRLGVLHRIQITHMVVQQHFADAFRLVQRKIAQF